MKNPRRISLLNRLAASDGMSIIEVMVALSILAIVTTGLVPMILSGLRSTVISKTETAAKNLTQERFELMRNLPFYVGSSTAAPPASCYNNPARTDPRNAGGAVECDYKDLLDTYFRSTFAATSTTTGGYVAANAGRSAAEVAAGVTAPFYRYVINPIPDFTDGTFSQVVATQFLTANRVPVTPPSTYNSQDSDIDLPPSRLLGVTVISSWNAGSRPRTLSVFSQIADGQIRTTGGLNEPTSVVLQAEATALRIRSGVSPTVELRAEAGISRSNGSLFNGARASTFAQGAYAQLIPGAKVDGRYQSASTPPESTPPPAGTSAAATLNATVGSDTFIAANMAATDVANVTAGVETGQPLVPKVNPGTSMSTGRLLLSGASTDFNYTNSPPAALNSLPLLDTSRPLVGVKASAGLDAASGRSYVKSTSGAAHYAESGAQAVLAETWLFPTTFASGGVIRVELVASSVTCKTTGGVTTGTSSSYQLRVKYFTLLGGYVTVPIDLVGGVLGNLLPDPATITVAPGINLDSYISSWTHLTSGVLNTNPATSVSAGLDGILQITSRQTRLADPTSTVKIDFGILSCVAEDRR